MFVCGICGLTVEKIPDDAVQIGKVYRFPNGEFHFLRKKHSPRTTTSKHRNPDREAPSADAAKEMYEPV